LIVLCALFFLHISFLTSKRYTARDMTFASEELYLNYLNSFPGKAFEWDLKQKQSFIEATQIEYLYRFPEQSILYIYLGYFIITTGLILSFQQIATKDK
jgi:hypothetical protein